MGYINASPDISDLKDQEKFRYIQLFLQECAQQFNGSVEILKNIKGKVVSVTFTSSNQNVSVDNPLGFIPNGYIPISLTTGTIVYDGNIANTSATLYFRGTIAGTARILVF